MPLVTFRRNSRLNTRCTTPKDVTQEVTRRANVPTTRLRTRSLTLLTFGLVTCVSLFSREHVLAADSSATNDLATTASNIAIDQQNRANLSFQQRDQLAFESRGRTFGTTYPIPDLDLVSVDVSRTGTLRLSKRPAFRGRIGDRYASVTPNNNYVFYTLDPELQEFVTSVVNRAPANHVAIVAMNPRTGAIMAIAGKSPTVNDIEYHAGFPAASLFKVVTAAAAVEEAGIDSNSLVAFRGGTYTLNQWNYLPSPRADRRLMSVGEAMGRSCNPVFGHIGLKYLNGSILSRYATKFGFNQSLDFEAPLPHSAAVIPHDDTYELSRTAAGFGEIKISPVHAAALVSGIANGGLLPRPQLVERIVDSDGRTLEESKPDTIQRIIQPSTAQSLLTMMRHTTTVGTSRREFMRGNKPVLGDIEVAAKTGTLSGTDPVGLNNWFIAAAPINNPELALAVITVDPKRAAKASHLGRLVFEKYFKVPPSVDVISQLAGEAAPKKTKRHGSPKHYRAVKKTSSKSSRLSSSYKAFSKSP